MCWLFLSLIGLLVIIGGVKFIMIDLEVLLVFFLIKLYFEKKFNNVFENIYIVLDMDEWINKYIYLWLLCNICDLSVRWGI